MKITIEPAKQKETEVIIRGDITSPDVESILNFIKSKNTSSKLFLYNEDEQFIVDASEIIYFEACNSRINGVTNNGIFDTKLKLYELKDKLSLYDFAQINKSTIVNINFVKSVQAEFSGNYTIRLKNREEILTISRKYFKEFKSKV